MKAFYLILLLPPLFLFSFEEKIEEEICVSSEEMKLYQLINTYRKSKGLDKIPLSSKLTKVAQVHSQDLADYYDFEKAETCNLHSWSEQGEWESCCYTSDHTKASCMWNKPGEIAGYSGNGYEISFYQSNGANAETGLETWQNSKSHHEVIINRGIWKNIKWNAIGIGIRGGFATVWFGEEKDPSKTAKICE
ncbi:MAG: CAP domain-containing protein [Cyclobacteriaceae bacterium]|nr:CAP domain-containing protein [Cyclobacteriaceae bacterium]